MHNYTEPINPEIVYTPVQNVFTPIIIKCLMYQFIIACSQLLIAHVLQFMRLTLVQ